MASHPPAHCCTIGVKHEGEPRGELTTIGETSVYLAHPPSPTDKAILLLTDILGHQFINAQLIADQFAANGYLVYMPDLFHGEALAPNRPADFDVMGWIAGHDTTRVDPVVAASVAELRGRRGVRRLAAVGYCFGAKYAVRFLGEGKGLDVGFVAHPSFVEVEELRGIRGPLSIAAAQTDSIFPVEKRQESERVLNEVGQPYQINLFSGVEHGFAVRGEMSNRLHKFAKELAFEQAVEWFNFHL